MSTIRFFTITIMMLATFAIGSAEAIDYIVSFTDGSNRVGYFVLKVNGASIKALPPVFSTGNAAIGTTTPYKLNNDVLIHHTFRGTNGGPAYGVAIFDFPSSKLKKKLSFQNFKLQGFYPLRIYGAQTGSTPRTMYAKTQNDISSALLKADGTPAGGKKPIFNNPAASDIVFGVDVSKDGSWAVQTLSKLQGFTRLNQFQIRRISNGGGTGSAAIITIPIPPYTPSLSGPIASSSGVFRWLGFRIFGNIGTSNQQSAVLIGKIDNATGRHSGQPKQVTNFARAMERSAESFPSVVVAPDGNFVIYTAYSTSCRKQILLLQRINPLTGNKIGGRKTLIGCGQLTNIVIGLYGIDLARIG